MSMLVRSEYLFARRAFATLLALALAGSACTGGSSAGQHESTLPGPTPVEQGDEAQITTEPVVATRPELAPEPVPELVFPDEQFRGSQPGAGDPRAFQLPRMQRFKLKNGIDVYLVEQHDLPIVSIDINFDGGSRNDPPGKEGLAGVCMEMLTEGTAELDKLAFKEALADTASRVSSYANTDTQGLSMGTLSKHFDATFALFRDALLRPGMRQEELDRMIKRRLDQLKQLKSAPGSVAWRVSGPVLYGQKHHRGRIATEASYQAITIDDCKSFHQRYLKPQGARLFVVGDMTEAQVRERFDKPLADWKGKVPAIVRAPKPRSRDGKVFFVNIPGAAQSTVIVTQFGPMRKAGDYMPNELMAAVLGGGFSSRINMNLRESKGYSYGARGAFNYSRENGEFSLMSSVRSDTTYQTVFEMMNELRALKSGNRPATDSELGREKNGAIMSLPGRFGTARQALGQYRELVYFGLPLDYYNKYVDMVGKVTLAEVAKSAKKHLDPDNAKIIVVGDAEAPIIHRVGDKDEPLMKDGKPVTLLEALRELMASGTLGKGELVIIDADGNPVANAVSAK